MAFAKAERSTLMLAVLDGPDTQKLMQVVAALVDGNSINRAEQKWVYNILS